MELKTTPRTRGNVVVQVFLGIVTFLTFASTSFFVYCCLSPPDAFMVSPPDAFPGSTDIVDSTTALAWKESMNAVPPSMASCAPSWWLEKAYPAGSPFTLDWLSVPLPRGSTAPEIELRSLAGKETFRLSQYRKNKPVVMAFGSFTCDRFQMSILALNKLYRQYKDRIAFIFVAVPEAGHSIRGFEFLLSDNHSTLTTDECYKARREHIERGRKKAGLLIPGYFDPPDYQGCRSYRAWPGRLIVVDTEGRVANDFGAGTPQIWQMDQVQVSLEWLCGKAGQQDLIP
jgi:Iodothyronine deiodinase